MRIAITSERLLREMALPREPYCIIRPPVLRNFAAVISNPPLSQAEPTFGEIAS
jgi:hypothetical protein